MSKHWKTSVTATAAGMATAIATAAGLLFAGGSTQVATQAAHVNPAANVSAVAQGQERTYFIAADEVPWDYAPDDKNNITGKAFTPDEEVFTKQGPSRIGHIYRKSLYRGYTDASFATKIVRPTSCAPTARACDDSLGMLGPVIRAVVGDTITVVFKNNTDYPASVHPHGVFYEKDAEGAPYEDGSSGANRLDDAVAPNATHSYSWKVPERAGPGPMDGSSITWMYHSHTDEVADTNSGLVGPMVITARGKADLATATPKDVDREIFSYYSVVNENESQYLDRNVEEFAAEPKTIAADDAEDFEESNLMHAINGYVYGNGPVPTMRKGQRVRWYDFTLGTEVDLHTPHWHGNTVTTNGMRSDMVQMLPGMMMASDMVPDATGTWLYHCHVNDHIVAGMQTRYRVTG